jgi:hypothetical protein
VCGLCVGEESNRIVSWWRKSLRVSVVCTVVKLLREEILHEIGYRMNII